jgi:hypothetical protein
MNAEQHGSNSGSRRVQKKKKRRRRRRRGRRRDVPYCFARFVMSLLIKLFQRWWRTTCDSCWRCVHSHFERRRQGTTGSAEEQTCSVGHMEDEIKLLVGRR